MDHTEKYFNELSRQVSKEYDLAKQARKIGFDPSNEVEIPLAKSLAEKTVGLISTLYPQLRDSKISKRILELEKEYGQLNFRVCLKIAEEVAKEKYCKFENLLKAIDAGARVGFAYDTLGVVASPIEGYTGLTLGKTKEGKDYFIVNFSGPIRSAGTTATCRFLMLIDYLRELFGYEKYDPSENEVKRYVTENYDYHERVTNLQYLPTEEEITFLAKNLPVQIGGDPTEKREVSNFKDLSRVPTNFIRGGMCLCFSEGLAQKAQKALRSLKEAKESGFVSTGWDYLEDYVILHKKREKGNEDTTATYIKDLVAGRPVYGHPSRSGSFRFRYGRGRSAGFSATSIHPATMFLSNNFLSNGTQLKIEKPTKGCIVTACDSIDGPIVKLKNGSVKKISDLEESKKIFYDVQEIIYLGDMLFPLGDVLNRNADLLKPGYVEEWWELELQKSLKEKKEKLNVDVFNISFKESLEISRKYKIPLHPSYIFYWSQITSEQFKGLINWLSQSNWNEKLVLPYSKDQKEEFFIGKRALELLGAEHEVFLDNVVVKEGEAFLFNLGISVQDKFLDKFSEILKNYKCEDVLKFVDSLSELKIKDKAGEFIGARMGRPEKAKLRKLTGSPNILFSVGEEGGRFRSLNEAVEKGFVKADFPTYFCAECKNETVYRKCEKCGAETKKKFYCRVCNQTSEKKCSDHEGSVSHTNRRLELKDLFDSAITHIGYDRSDVPTLIKGIRGTSSDSHEVEHLAKGILRAKHNLCVNKDGTVRYDGTEIPLTHFKPKEIGTSVEKLRELGYSKDCYGEDLRNADQILNLMPHDILLPSCPDTADEKADDVFLNLTKFVDDLLEKFYKLPRHYNLKSREDLIGQLVACMAPHNCAGVIGRIIGFTKMQGLVASPFMHAAMRRDCVYPATNFVYSKNRIIKNEKIGHFVEDLIKKRNTRKKIDNFGTEKIEINEEIYAFGVDVETKKIKKKKIKYFIKGKSPERWIKMKTASGREQIMTPRHKFIYLDKNNEFKTKTAKEIIKGDRIALINNFSGNNEIKEVNLVEGFCETLPLEELKKIRIVDGKNFFKKVINNVRLKNRSFLDELELVKFSGSSDWYNLIPLSDVKRLFDKGFLEYEKIPVDSKIRTIFNNKKWDLKFKINKDLMSVLGYYSAEGHSRKNKTVSQVSFRIIDKKQKEKLVYSIKKAFGVKPIIEEDGTKITICNKLIYYLLKYYFKCGSKAYTKKVPNLLYNVSGDLVKEYLSTYFDGDGSIVPSRNSIVFYSVSRELLDGIALLINRFGMFGRFQRTGERLPGKKVLDRYRELGKEPKKHVLNHLVFSGKDFYGLSQILNPVCRAKANKIRKAGFREIDKRKIVFDRKVFVLEEMGNIFVDIVKEVESFKDNEPSYCFDVEADSEEDKNVLWGEQIINFRCDGDEAAVMLLMDVLLNFSLKFLPSHRGGTQDAPLVLNTRIREGEVDDQILDFETCWNYPLELYEAAEQKKHSSEIHIETVKSFLKEGKSSFKEMGFTHNTEDIHSGVFNSSYKLLPSMREKVFGQMELADKLRSVDQTDVARLVIERHFIRDIRGNLRKFSHQVFRCSKCNSKYRRPPLVGVCKCGGRIIFTISEGSIKKYLEPAIELAKKYNISSYTKQSLELAKVYIESIFGRESEKQVSLGDF
jgi:DNA polymerase II large subunit